jgi:hypothetical protein
LYRNGETVEKLVRKINMSTRRHWKPKKKKKKKRKSAYHPLRSLKDRYRKKAIGRWSPKGESQDPFNKK